MGKKTASTADNKQVAVSGKEKDELGLDVSEMAQAGLHLGQRVSRTHPKMKPYIFGVRNTIHIIDLEKTVQKLNEALEFIKKLACEGKTILFVGTKVQIKDLVKEIAEQCQMPYVNERWLGGTFTNFGIMLKRIEYLKELDRKREEGELAKYTKKERKEFDEEIADLRKKFGGIVNMTRLPDAVFVCDMRGDHGAIKEARMKNIPVIAISDTNCDPSLADYPIPANDDAISAVRYILEKVRTVILQAKTLRPHKS